MPKFKSLVYPQNTAEWERCWKLVIWRVNTKLEFLFVTAKLARAPTQLSKLKCQRASLVNNGQIMKKKKIFPSSPTVEMCSMKNHFTWFHPVNMQPDKTRTTRTPAFWGYPQPPHDYPCHWVISDPKSKEDKVKVTNLKNSPKFQIFELWNKPHIIWSCLIRCANMKWIRWELLKIQSGHDSVHRWTDRQTDKVKPIYPPFNFV